jgi:hypothetical protein
MIVTEEDQDPDRIQDQEEEMPPEAILETEETEREADQET